MSAQQKPTTGYAPVNGINMYYEVHGGGEPVVYLTAGIGEDRVNVPSRRAFAAQMRSWLNVEPLGRG